MEKLDINVKLGDYIVNLRAVAIITNDNKILFQKRKKDEFWALPGGKIKVGETGENAIKRELSEELGILETEISRVHSISEYFFNFGEDKYHQYIFAYVVNIKDNEILKNIEFDGVETNENLIFKWFDLSSIKDAPIKPDFLKNQLSNLEKAKETVFVSYEDNN